MGPAHWQGMDNRVGLSQIPDKAVRYGDLGLWASPKGQGGFVEEEGHSEPGRVCLEEMEAETIRGREGGRKGEGRGKKGRRRAEFLRSFFLLLPLKSEVSPTGGQIALWAPGPHVSNCYF